MQATALDRHPPEVSCWAMIMCCPNRAGDNARELVTWCIPQGAAVATESLGCVITGGTKGFGFALAQVQTGSWILRTLHSWEIMWCPAARYVLLEDD